MNPDYKPRHFELRATSGPNLYLDFDFKLYMHGPDGPEKFRIAES